MGSLAIVPGGLVVTVQPDSSIKVIWFSRCYHLGRSGQPDNVKSGAVVMGCRRQTRNADVRQNVGNFYDGAR
jgi:hypothetical protein